MSKCGWTLRGMRSVPHETGPRAEHDLLAPYLAELQGQSGMPA